MENVLRNILRLEELAQLLACIYIFSLLNFSWWWFAFLLLTPDIGILGYLINPKIGALTYNFLHNKITALLFYSLGIYFSADVLKLIGVILYAHAAMDRTVGYGLKYSNAFAHTHLGTIKKIF